MARKPFDYTKALGDIRRKELGNGSWGSMEDRPEDRRRATKPLEYTPPMNQEQTVAAMPNADKLSNMERSIYRALPGFTESKVGQALAKFGESWAGKALMYIDIAAEGVERSVGVLMQVEEDQRRSNELGITPELNTLEGLTHAWYAGSLASDVTNLPMFTRDENDKITGFRLPTDLPGQAGLVDARKKIASGIPLEQVRSELYEDLGALQLRSQLYDTYFHVVADPLNYIMPMLAPVERANAARKGIMAGNKVTQAGMEALQAAEDVAKAAGNVTDAAKIADRIAHSQLLSQTDRLILTLTGGDPLANPTTKLGKLGRSRFNPFSLTPEARAQEMATMTVDHVGSYILSVIDDPVEIVETISRGAQGALGQEFGHAFINLEGRTVQAALSGFDAHAQDMLKAWLNTTEDRVLLQDLAKIMDVHPDKLLTRIVDVIDDEIELAAMAGRLGVEPKILKDLGKVFEEIPHNEAIFKLYLSNKIADHAAQQGVLQFGVKSRGFASKVGSALKSAETMAFLRLNPAYAIRNMVNNEFTMLARGLVGRVMGKNIDDIWGRIGFKPPRLEQGFGAMGYDLGQATKAGKLAEMSASDVMGQPIFKALRGERGFLDRFADSINGIKLGKVDATVWGAAHERAASKRAMTIGTLEGMRKYYWKPGKGYDFSKDVITPDMYDFLSANHPGVLETVEDAIAGALSNSDIDKVTRGNLNLNLKSILDDASEKAGFKVDDVLPAEYIATHEEGLLKAAGEGETAVREYVVRMKNDIQENMDDFLDPRILQKETEIVTRIEAEGIGATNAIFADELDSFWYAHQQYAARMQNVSDAVGQGMGKQAQHEIWKAIKHENGKFWDRQWKEFDATVRAIRQGAEKKGFLVPDEIEHAFRQIQDETKGFFKRRDELQEVFFEARLKNEKPPVSWKDIQAKTTDEYKQLIEVEDALNTTVDNALAHALPDEIKDNFLEWRKKARSLRREDKELVVSFRNTLAETKGKAAQAKLWEKFWKDRQSRWQELWSNDRMGLAAMTGNAQAKEPFEAAIAALDEFENIPNILKSDTFLDTVVDVTTEEGELVGRLVEIYGTEAHKSKYTKLLDDWKTSDLGAKAFAEGIEETTEAVGQTQKIADDFRDLVTDVHRLAKGENVGAPIENIMAQARAVSENPADQLRKMGSLFGVRTPEKAAQVTGDKILLATVNKQARKGGMNIDSELFKVHGNSPVFMKGLDDAWRTGGDDAAVDFLKSEIANPALSREDVAERYTSMVQELYEGVEQYKNLEDIPLEEAEKLLRSAAEGKGYAPGEYGLDAAFEPLRPDRAKQAAQVVKNVLPEDAWRKNVEKVLERWSTEAIPMSIREEMVQEAGRMLDRLNAAEPGYLTFDYTSGPGVKVGGVKSSFPKWWKEMQGSKGRVTVAKALEKIIAGGTLDEGVWVERMKYLIFSRMSDPGDVPNPVVLLELGNERAAWEFLVKELDDGIDFVDKYGDVTGNKFYRLLQESPDDLTAFAKPRPSLAEQTGIVDFQKVMPNQAPIHKAQDEFWLNKGFASVDAMGEGAIAQAKKTPLIWDDLPPEAVKELEGYISHSKGQLSDARYASIRFGEYRRDTALLNYNRRYNYNTWLGTIAPFEFWTTQSLAKWALHSIDRPAMLSSYLRMKKMLETAGAPDQELPSRLKGALRIATPFLPDWMEDSLYVDPMRVALPFDAFTFGYEEMQKKQMTLEGRTSRLIEQAINDGKIDAAAGAQAIQGEGGEVWEEYKALAMQNDKELKFDAVDFMTLMTPPHAPLMWAKEVAEGTPENIGAFTPLSRTAKGVAGLMGIDWDNHPMNMEAKLRKAMGLPAFDKWDDYRIERMLSNMAYMQEITTEEALRATIDHEGEAWEEAKRKANFEFGISTVGSSLGIPVKPYPEGERGQRSLKDDFDRAYSAYGEGDVDALTTFFEDHPEYETRLGLFKEPEERLKGFLVDEIWNTYNDLPSLNKKEIRAQLGDAFYDKFLSKETRSYDAITPEELQVWLKLMGGDPPGTMTASVPHFKMTDPDIAYRAQVFYDNRNELFPGWYDAQKVYFELAKGGARKGYLGSHPELKAYWDWRNDWLHRNPGVAPYLSDDYEFEYKSEGQRAAAYDQEPNFTWEEWQNVLSPSMQTLVQYAGNGNALPPAGEAQLDQIAEEMGLDRDALLDKILESSPFGQPYTPSPAAVQGQLH